MIEYQIIRSARKTLSLQVKHGQVFVRAPFRVDEKLISLFIQKKKAWLRAKISEQNKTKNLSCTFTQGSTLFLFGQLVTLNIAYAGLVDKTVKKQDEAPTTYLSKTIVAKPTLTVVLPARFKNKLLTTPQLALAVKKQLEYYFTQQAQQIILPKVEYYSALTKLVPTAIKIRQYRARWGSCNNKGELSFNYLLMMLPLDVIDYVIVHELCHLQHLNHSKDFWQLVSRYFPTQEVAKQWIKTNQSALHWRLPAC